jgi:serine phosphatase RsbU (regulator of sigma subunit)
MYGLDRLKQRVAAFKAGRAYDLVEWIISDVRAFTNGAELHDDMTVLVMRFKGDEASTAI